jgi:hypothetical protein
MAKEKEDYIEQPDWDKIDKERALRRRIQENAPSMYELLTELEKLMRQFPALEGSRSLIVAVLSAIEGGK